MKSNLIIKNLVLFVVPQKPSVGVARDLCLSIWFDLLPLSAQLWKRVEEGGGTGTSDKQITLGRTWPGGHVLYCVGSRLTEIENRNRNQQKWNRKQMQNDVKRKPNRYRNTKTQRRGRERERDTHKGKRGEERKCIKPGVRGGRQSCYQRKAFPSAMSCNAIAEILAALSLSLLPLSSHAPLSWPLRYAKLCQKHTQVNLFVSVWRCVGLAKQGSTVCPSFCLSVCLSIAACSCCIIEL